MNEILKFEIKKATVERIAVFDVLPDSALVDIAEISALAARSRASLWRDVHEGRLPVPRKIGPNANRWRVGDVRRYMTGGRE